MGADLPRSRERDAVDVGVLADRNPSGRTSGKFHGTTASTTPTVHG